MIPATINVFVKPQNDNITFIDIAIISLLATNKTGRSMPLVLTFLHSLPAITQGQNGGMNESCCKTIIKYHIFDRVFFTWGGTN